jgi:hypothetical protein
VSARRDTARLAICGGLSLVMASFSCGRIESAGDSVLARQCELDVVLKAVEKQPPAPDIDGQGGENPGWYEPTNQQALARFISKYPDTEESFLAQTWLIFAQSATGRKMDLSEEEQRRAARAASLTTIIQETTRPETAKMARIQSAAELHAAADYAGSARQIDEILAHIKEYQSETGSQFANFLRAEETPQSDLEPTLRQMRLIEECHQHHFESALAAAKA